LGKVTAEVRILMFNQWI